uniref:Uncharacterized protein n=1 Tax=Onchocerca volvulus TaxID=6282 RepID=A0A8R1TWW6_ONCVO
MKLLLPAIHQYLRLLTLNTLCILISQTPSNMIRNDKRTILNRISRQRNCLITSSCYCYILHNDRKDDKCMTNDQITSRFVSDSELIRYDTTLKMLI